MLQMMHSRARMDEYQKQQAMNGNCFRLNLSTGIKKTFLYFQIEWSGFDVSTLQSNLWDMNYMPQTDAWLQMDGHLGNLNQGLGDNESEPKIVGRVSIKLNKFFPKFL